MPEEKYKNLIEKGAEIAGAISGTAIGLLAAGPIGAFGGAALSPIFTELFKNVGNDLSDMLLSNREKVRIGATYSYAIEKLNREIENGKHLRQDNFYSNQNNDRSNAATILEGTLLKSRNEYEEKKIKYYANFLANINFDSSTSFEKGNTLLRIIEQLSYRQLVILAYCESVDFINTKNWKVSFSQNENLGKYQDFYSEIMDLYNHQLLQEAGNGVTMGIPTMKISPFGKTLCNLLNLKEVDTEDKDLVSETIFKINSEI